MGGAGRDRIGFQNSGVALRKPRRAGLGGNGGIVLAEFTVVWLVAGLGRGITFGGGVFCRGDDRLRVGVRDGAEKMGLYWTGVVSSVEEWSGKGRGHENFPVGSWLIRRDLRTHMHAFYSFARNADDIADSPVLAAEDKIFRLDVMEGVLLGRRDDGSSTALGLRASLAATGVVATHACDLLVAFRQDAVKTRYASWEELEEYCRYSAMPVGRHVLDLHGEGRETYAPSDALCASLQVLNHVQDCARDLVELDRSYLPLEFLSPSGAAVEDVRGVRESPGLREVFGTMLDRVAAWNKVAADLPRRVRDRRLRLETAVICGVAQRLARRLHEEDPVAGRVKLTRFDGVGSLVAAMRFLL